MPGVQVNVKCTMSMSMVLSFISGPNFRAQGGVDGGHGSQAVMGVVDVERDALVAAVVRGCLRPW